MLLYKNLLGVPQGRNLTLKSSPSKRLRPTHCELVITNHTYFVVKVNLIAMYIFVTLPLNLNVIVHLFNKPIYE